ncbi:MAG: NAD(P)-dependent glycerol-3-phosphate dehydrogenase [Polyangiaceae bacterium]|nr:NAD(P)-dependent glycerol-3-phosphate dehydrogenase [Polyangiaceae bacterium]
MASIAVIGAGAWGTALARLLGQHGAPVALWTWQVEHALCMQRDRVNAQFFPSFSLPDCVRVTSDIADALEDAALVLLVVPSDVFRSVLTQARPYIPDHAALVSAAKGIENGSLMLMGEIIHDVLGESALERSAALSGPSFASELARGLLTNVVVAGPSSELCSRIQVTLSIEPLRVYTSDDRVGVEMGGALKNVIAIAAGACDGLGFGHNTRAALITRGLAEITRLAVAKGGHPMTLSGLAGMGDLVLTCTGDLSRNRTVGFDLGRGEQLQDVLARLGHVAEGVPTARSAYCLARQLGVDLPICSEVYRVLFEGKAPRDAVRELTARPLRQERD